MNADIGLLIFVFIISICVFIFLMGITMLLLEKKRKRDKKAITIIKTNSITELELGTVSSRLNNYENSMKKTPNKYAHWIGYWKALFIACRKHNATSTWEKADNIFLIAPPASENEVINIEQKLGHSIPENFRNVLLQFSSKVDIYWTLNDGDEAPEPLDGVNWGECRWDLQDLPRLMEDYKSWITKCFSNPNDPYDAVWHNKFPIVDIINGDMIAIDLASSEGTIIYLSHDDGEGHGNILGTNFADYIERHSKIGCPGYEEWLLTPFSPNEILDPDCENAIAWRNWFGLEINNEQ